MEGAVVKETLMAAMIDRLDDYQALARKTMKQGTLEHLGFGLFEEAGEVAGIFKRIHRHDPGYRTLDGQALTPETKEKIIKELGDVLWYVSMLADALEVRLSEVATHNISKLSDRAARGTIKGSGNDR